MEAVCIDCHTDFNPKRLEFGYRTCLDCGSTRALREMNRKAKCSAPAYNKGGYQVISKENIKNIGK